MECVFCENDFNIRFKNKEICEDCWRKIRYIRIVDRKTKFKQNTNNQEINYNQENKTNKIDLKPIVKIISK